MTDEKTIRIYDAKAGDYVRNFSGKGPSGHLKKFMSHLPEGAHVLDWGCGPGDASFHMKAAGFVPDPVDASTEMVALARDRFALPARLGTFQDPLPVEAYQGAWVNFSLLHAPRDAMPGHLQCLFGALVPGGLFHIGMKRGTGAHRDKFGRYYTYFQTEELIRLLETAGFVMIEYYEGEGAGLAGNIEPFVLILSRKP